jgi:hypothetical protein
MACKRFVQICIIYIKARANLGKAAIIVNKDISNTSGNFMHLFRGRFINHILFTRLLKMPVNLIG